MTRFSGKNRRESTVLRDDKVHEIYAEIRAELGELTDVISRQYIYERIKMKTGLCTKTIAFILNHTIKRNLTNGGVTSTFQVIVSFLPEFKNSAVFYPNVFL